MCRQLVHPEYSFPISQVPGYNTSSCGSVVEQAESTHYYSKCWSGPWHTGDVSVCLFLCVSGSHYVIQMGLKLWILLPQPPKYWAWHA